MTVTVASIQARAPEYDDDDVVQMFIDQAALFVSSDAWSTRYDIALTYLTLHMMTLHYRSQAASGGAPGSGGAAEGGAVKWRQADNLQIGTGGAANALGANFRPNTNDPWFQLTAWGQAFASMKATVLASRVI